MESRAGTLVPQLGQQRQKQEKAQSLTTAASYKTSQSNLHGAEPKLAEIDIEKISSGKGGGALRSIDQKFEVNPCNGTLSLNLPLQITQARNNFQPSLALSYNSGSGNSAFGLGWDIALDNITRKTSKRIPQYNEKDVFLLSGADDLVPVTEPDKTSNGYRIKRFRPRVTQAGAAMRIELWTSLDDVYETYWRTISETNVVKIYGRTDESRIFEKTPNDTKRIFSWLICEAYDASGNAMEFSYKAEDDLGVIDSNHEPESCELQRHASSRSRARYIKSVKYGNYEPSREIDTWRIIPVFERNNRWLFEVVFDYGEHDADVPTTEEVTPWHVRKDPFSRYSSGFEIRTYRLCQRILMFHHFKEKLDLQDYLISSYGLSYEHLPTGSRIVSTSFGGYQWISSGNGGHYIHQNVPTCKYEYTQSALLQDVVPQTTKPAAFQALPHDAPGATTKWIDLYGEGTQGVLIKQDAVWYYQRNENAINAASEPEENDQETPSGNDFGSLQELNIFPNTKDQPLSYFDDVDGNGYQDLVVLDNEGRLHGYVECVDKSTWKPLHEFPKLPNLDASIEKVQRIDLTGSGRSDVIVPSQTSNEILWYESLGKKGFSSERRSQLPEKMPHILYRSERSATYHMDMSGDGLADILVISNGRISYWPNLGYGKFDQEIIMDNSPIFCSDDEFSLKRMRLLDCDGSGTTDILYLQPDGGAVVYYNLCGNGWSDGVFIPNIPRVDDLSDVFAMDLLGKGTSCVCWSGPEGGEPGREYVISYLDLGGTAKPNLLKSWSSGTGLSTSIKYSPSTKFYLQDERSGVPWVTKLPFPVHVVSSAIISDEVVKSSHTTQYAYHDGHYDEYEHEFRGFAVVDKWETEDFTIKTGKKLKKPTLHTKLWFHTGAEQLGLTASSSVPYGKIRLNSSIPPDLFTDDLLDAFRALKGSQLRSECYGEDRNDIVDVPYNVVETSYDVVLIELSDDNERPATFRVDLREKVTLHYERNEKDPRTVHDLVIETNEYGDATKAINVQYGRSLSSDISDALSSQQKIDHITFTETTYTNDLDEADDFYKPVIASEKVAYTNRTHEVQLLDLSELRLQGVQKLGGALQRGRETRILYKATNLSDKPLDLGKLELFSPVHQVFQLALTNSIFADVYGKEESVVRGLSFEDVISKHCAYVDLDKDKCLWSASNQLCFDYDNEDTNDRLKSARQHFLLPSGSRDPFGNTTILVLDEFSLLPVKTTDAAGNTTHAENDYGAMQGATVTDANGNRIHVGYDCLGQTTALARIGKIDEKLGDSLEGVSLAVSDDELISFIGNPSQEVASTLIGNSSTRWLICRTRQSSSSNNIPQCMFTVNLTRTEQMASTESIKDFQGDICVSVTYLDGRSREIQRFNLVDWNVSEDNWTVSSSKIQDVAGNTIIGLASYFSSGCTFDILSDTERSLTISFVDALGRQIGALKSDHTWTKKQLTPWSITEFDAGDTLSIVDPRLDPDVGYFFSKLERSLFEPSWRDLHSASEFKQTQIALQQSLMYVDKPSTTHLDSRGKIVQIIEKGDGRTRTTRFDYDVLGNQSAMYDALGQLVEKTHFDNLGRLICKTDMDTGVQSSLLNCIGKPVIEKNSRGIQRRFVYDSLNRIIETRVWESGAPSEILWSKRVYGDMDKSIPGDAKEYNLRNKIFALHDQSGISRYLQYDSKGNCTRSSRQLALEYKSALDWTGNVKLADETYTMTAVFDILDREVSRTDAAGYTTKRKYNLTNSIQSIYSNPGTTNSKTTYHIVKATYTSDGNASRIDYGNSSHSAFAYDEKTRRLTSRRTWRDDGVVLEDSKFTYDCLGRLVHSVDDAQQTEFFRNNQITPQKTFRYDDFGRLVNATGRESIEGGGNAGRSLRVVSASSPSAQGVLRSQSGSELCEYSETYTYDDADNILRVQHDSRDVNIAGWTRKYQYKEKSLLNPKEISNRLTSTKVGKLKEHYGYDDDAGKVGCMTFMTGYSRLGWDANNKLRFSARQRVNEGIPETTWYVYDDNGQRVRKVTDSAVTTSDIDTTIRKLKETLYIDSAEIFTTYTGNGETIEAVTRTSLVQGGSIKDKNLVATIEWRHGTSLAESEELKTLEEQLIRYHVNSDLEVDDKAQVISYEEYNPFGVSVLLACRSDIEAPRRYRYAAYQRDHETGFYACGARYYAPWLGRWTSPDPLGTVDGPNLYAYVKNDPINWVDPQGTKGKRVNPAEIYKVNDPPPNSTTDNHRRGGIQGSDSLDTPEKVQAFHKMVTKQLKNERGFFKGLWQDNKDTIAKKAATIVIGEALGLIPLVGGLVKGGFNAAASKLAAMEEMKKYEKALDDAFLRGATVGQVLEERKNQIEAGKALSALQENTPEGKETAEKILSGMYYGKDNLPKKDVGGDDVYYSQSPSKGNGVQDNKIFPGGYCIGQGKKLPTGFGQGGK